MSKDLVTTSQNSALVAERNPGNMLDMHPKLKIQVATEIANILKDIIDSQELYKMIGKGKHVVVEGWTTLGTLLGVTPREKSVEETPDGSYIASVDLVRADTGCVIGGGSALCSVDEENWSPSRVDKFARRSMAITRATGKAYRLSFSWIMTLAGYHATPYEEMPDKHTPFNNSNNEKSEPSAGTKQQPRQNLSQAIKQPSNLGDYVIRVNSGNLKKGDTLSNSKRADIEGVLRHWKGKTVQGPLAELLEKGAAYLALLDTPLPGPATVDLNEPRALDDIPF